MQTQNLDLDARVADHSDDRALQTNADAPRTRRTFKETIVDAIKAYYTPTAFERKNDAQVYRYAGAHIFRKIIPTGGDYAQRFFGNVMRGWTLKDRIQRSRDRAKGLQQYIAMTYALETSHIFLGSYFAARDLQNYANTHDNSQLAGDILFNIAINLYPIFVQRYNRARSTNTLEHVQARAQHRVERKQSFNQSLLTTF